MPSSKCKHCMKKLTLKNQESNDTDTLIAMPSSHHHRTNNDCKENEDPKKTQEWVQNKGPGTCKKYSIRIEKKPQSTKTTTTITNKTNIAPQLIKPQTERHPIDDNNIKMMESTIRLLSSTHIETIIVSDDENDACHRPSNSKSSANQTELDETVKFVNNTFSGPSSTGKISTIQTEFDDTLINVNNSAIRTESFDTMIENIDDVRNRVDNLVKNNILSDWTLPNNAIVANVSTQNYVRVYMTEEKLNKLIQDELIRLIQIKNREQYFD